MNLLFSRKQVLYVTITIVTIMLYGPKTLSAQEIPESLESEMASQRQSLSAREAKINTHLREVIREMKAAGITRQAAAQQNTVSTFSTPLVNIDDNGRVYIALRVTDITPELHRQLKDLEFETTASTENLDVTRNLQMIVGWAFFDRIEDIAHLDLVFNIRPVDQPIHKVGSVTPASDGILRANLIRSKFCIDGSGETVGVISDGVNHWREARATGDLPQRINILRNRDFLSSDEGTAMLEIVHDLTPGAALAFSDAGRREDRWPFRLISSPVDVANSIFLLSRAGATVIVDDVGFPTLEPMYEDGILAQTVDDIVNDWDVVYASAAGNDHLNHYEGDFVSTDDDKWHNFTPVDETIDVKIGSRSEVRVVLQWSNQFGRSSDNYDLFLVDDPLKNILARSTEIQHGNADPVEFFRYINKSNKSVNTHVAIRKESGANQNFSVYIFYSTPQEHVGTGGAIYGHSGAQRALSVGAISQFDRGFDDIANYSSRGPVRICSYDVNGRPASCVDRPKPDHVAMADVPVSGAGGFPRIFSGTSAAAPHTAAIAALVWQANPDLTAIQVGDVLNNNAIDLGRAGFDFTYGNGRVDAFSAVSSQSPERCPDVTSPTCSAIDRKRNSEGHVTTIITSASDLESGIARIEFTNVENAHAFLNTDGSTLGPFSEGQNQAFDPSTTDRVGIRGERIDVDIAAALAVRITNGDGLSRTCDPVLATLTAEVPEAFRLEQNYPNPFNPQTTIRFQVAEQAHVVLEIYDVMGRKVATLIDQALGPGTYAAEWGGRNEAGWAMAGGTYVYRVQAGSFTETKVMTLLK